MQRRRSGKRVARDHELDAHKSRFRYNIIA